MALFNSAMFGGGAGLLPYSFQVPEWADKGVSLLNPVGSLPRMLASGEANIASDAAKWLGSQFFTPAQANPTAPTNPAFVQAGGGGGWGDGPAPAPLAAQPAPQAQAMPSWAQSPAQAAQGMAAADNSFQWGNQTYPMYGGPAMAQVDPAALPPNAQPTAGRAPMPQGPINPQAAAPAMQSELFNKPSANPGSDAYYDFFDRFKEGYKERVDAKKAQAETARGMYELLTSQGIPEKRAAAVAVMAARNPDILKEYMKPPTTIEGGIARGSMFGAAGGQGGQPGSAPLQSLSDVEAAKEKGKLDAKTASEASQLANELPAFAADAKEHLRQVAELRNHPGRKGNMWWHGKMSPYLPDTSITGNTDAFDANSRLSQIKGGAFLEAFKALKGGGQVTEIEGKKATDAIARMNRASSEKEFNAALDDYSGAITRGLDKLHQQARQAPPFGFKGNDGWQTVAPDVRIRERR